MLRSLLASCAMIMSMGAFADDRSAAVPGTELYFVAPADGAIASNPVTVRFGLKGMGVAPAGIKFEGAGHHHLFIDTDVPADLSQPLPPAVENKIMHFGKGQTEVTLTLAPGKHTLQLCLGDYLHVPHNPPVVSKKITITVK
jgi:hypothetical protein